MSRLALAKSAGPVYAGNEADIKRIAVLDSPDGKVVGRVQGVGTVGGEFCLFQDGTVRFRYVERGEAWFYVNRGFPEFQAAARLFNAFCWSAYDPDDPECDYFEELARRFGAELEKIEPLGDPTMSLWGATVHNTEAGLWTLY